MALRDKWGWFLGEAGSLLAVLMPTKQQVSWLIVPVWEARVERCFEYFGCDIRRLFFSFYFEELLHPYAVMFCYEGAYVEAGGQADWSG